MVSHPTVSAALAVKTAVVKLPARFIRLLIAIYRYGISPFIPNRCRYYPTCSAYADEAIRRYGVVRGGGLAVRRLCRCHPWGGHGVDPVPDLTPSKSTCCQRNP